MLTGLRELKIHLREELAWCLVGVNETNQVGLAEFTWELGGRGVGRVGGMVETLLLVFKEVWPWEGN